MALIMAIAIVGILSGIALTFAYNMRIDEKAAANYLYMVKARYLAEAGIARAIAELKNDAASSSWLISQIDRLYNSDLAEVWADASTISGPINGALGEGYFDFRYARIGVEGYGISDILYADSMQDRYLNETSNNKVNGHVVSGIIDEERKININYANSTLLDGLPEIGSATYNDIIDNRPYNTITEILKTDIGPDLLYGDDDGGTSQTNADNHTLDSAETDAVPTGVLNGGIEDLVTVYNDSLVIVDSSTNTVPVNVNTASETVLKAVIASSSITGGITGLSDTESDRVVKAILEYRSGKDYDDGSSVGDGNPNPFDGIDQNRNDGIDPNVSEFASNGDNDGDGTIDEPDEVYMFAGGPRGEFNALIDYICSTGYNGGGTLSDIQDAINIKDNADTAANVDYSGDGNPDDTVWTTSFIFDSKYFQIISTGVVERGGIKLAEQKVMQIVGPIE